MDLLKFKVVIEPDEDAWQAYYPAWEHLGAATCGETREAAAANLKEVLELILDEIEEGAIAWPVAPGVPHQDFSRPGIQDAPEFVPLKCAPEYPAAVASHGGLPVDDHHDRDLNAIRNLLVASHGGLPVDDHPSADPGDCYRLIYIAMDDVLAAIHARQTLMAARSEGRVSRIFTPPTGNLPPTGAVFAPVSRGEQTRVNKLPAN